MIGTVLNSIASDVANEALAKRSDSRQPAYRLVRDGNSAAMPPTADAPEFGGMRKMKESTRIRGHSNSRLFVCRRSEQLRWNDVRVGSSCGTRAGASQDPLRESRRDGPHPRAAGIGGPISTTPAWA